MVCISKLVYFVICAVEMLIESYIQIQGESKKRAIVTWEKEGKENERERGEREAG